MRRKSMSVVIGSIALSTMLAGCSSVTTDKTVAKENTTFQPSNHLQNSASSKQNNASHTSKTLPTILAVIPDFINAQTGFVAATSGLLETSNAGDTWTIKSTPPGTVQQISFANRQTGWILVNPKPMKNAQAHLESLILYHTTDGGQTWKRQWKGKFQTHETSQVLLQALSTHFLVVHCGADLYVSSDGGKSWSNRKIQGQSIFGIDFTAPNVGEVVSGPPNASSGSLNVWKTTDGGKHWIHQYHHSKLAQKDGSAQIAIRGSEILVMLNVAYLSQTYAILSKDGGESWTPPMTNGLPQTILPVSHPIFVSKSKVLAPVGASHALPGSLMISSNAGLKFQGYEKAGGPPIPNKMWSECLLSHTFGSVVYGVVRTRKLGTILVKSEDRGTKWNAYRILGNPLRSTSITKQHS